MLLLELAQQRGGWQFDPTSALIGAAIALFIARVIYIRREKVKQLGLRLWTPVVTLRNRLQASKEEKYLSDLQRTLKDLLFFKPDDPQIIFQPPTFSAPPPLPTTLPAEDVKFPAPLDVPFANIQDGHPRIIITGSQASGRTFALAMTVWQTAQRASRRRPYERFPVWVDLTRLKDLPESDETTPLERLAQLAADFMPNLTPKWVLSHLRTEPSLILVDNWDVLPPDERTNATRWIANVTQSLPKSCWLVTAGQTGYGPLVEAEFVPLGLTPASGEAMATALYSGWQQLLGDTTQELSEEALYTLLWADQAGATLLELTIRIILYLQTAQLPIRPVDVLDRFLDNAIPTLNLGEDQVEVAEQARMFALNTLSFLAKTHRLEGYTFSQQDIVNVISEMLPPEGTRPPKLENAVRRTLTDSKLLQRQGKVWTLSHPIWDDFLTAWALVEDENGANLAKTHLTDPTWALLLEFYAGLATVTPMIRTLLDEAITYGNYESLLRAVRWSLAAPEDVVWRKGLIKVLAQTFTASDVDEAMRLRLGRALVLAAGEGARAFFVQTLRHPSTEIRAAGLRGLGWSGSPQEMPLLSGALHDPDIRIRQSAVKALADLGTSGAVRVLRDAMYEIDEQLLPTIAEALSKSAAGQEALKEAATSELLLIRRTAAQGLSEIDEPWATAILETLAREDSEWLVRSAAEIGLTAREERTTVKTVAIAPPQVDKIEWLIAWAAERGQGLGVGEAAMTMLEQATTRGEAQAKMLGALTLAYIGRKAHLTLLEPLLADADLTVRHVVEQTMQRIEQRYRVYQGT